MSGSFQGCCCNLIMRRKKTGHAHIMFYFDCDPFFASGYPIHHGYYNLTIFSHPLLLLANARRDVVILKNMEEKINVNFIQFIRRYKNNIKPETLYFLKCCV